jgi:hypothetical protein
MISMHVSFFPGQNFKSYSFISRIVSAEKKSGNLYSKVDNYKVQTRDKNE